MPSRLPHIAPMLCCLALTAASAAGAPDLEPRHVDAAGDPCAGFYDYANGAWLKSATIPPGHGHWGLDEEIGQRNLDLLHTMLEEAAAHPAPEGTPQRRIGDFYAAAMDETAIERGGVAPLRADLDEIAALQTPADVAALIRRWQQRGLDPVFELQAQEDMRDAGIEIPYAIQGGLGLGDRGAYLRAETAAALLRARYRKHIEHMLALAGERDAVKAATQVVDLETRLARASLDMTELLDPGAAYQPLDLSAADALTPHFSWSSLLSAAGTADAATAEPATPRRISLAPHAFFSAFDAALADEPVAAWQAYLRWHLLDDAAPYLGKAFADADFEFRMHMLRGIGAPRPRWELAVEATSAALGEDVGRAYVARVMPPAARERARELAARLKTALRARLQALDWMSPPTRAAALAKLDAMTVKVGYPDRWHDRAIPISRDSYYGNVRAALAAAARSRFERFGRAVDRDDWDLPPQALNAYYNPMRNEIVFPAAQLQPPYFDPDADDALNYGAIGAVIGHELVHAFDDRGSRFDAHGNLADWWTVDDRAQFDLRAARLAAQYDAYAPVAGRHVDGKRTLGENMADLGGLLVAWDAFRNTAEGRSGGMVDGRSPDQRFFLAYAHSWREKQLEPDLLHQLRSSEHAPARYRVDGPLADMPEFARAFGCKPPAAMARGGANVKIW